MPPLTDTIQFRVQVYMGGDSCQNVMNIFYTVMTTMHALTLSYMHLHTIESGYGQSPGMLLSYQLYIDTHAKQVHLLLYI